MGADPLRMVHVLDRPQSQDAPVEHHYHHHQQQHALTENLAPASRTEPQAPLSEPNIPAVLVTHCPEEPSSTVDPTPCSFSGASASSPLVNITPALPVDAASAPLADASPTALAPMADVSALHADALTTPDGDCPLRSVSSPLALSPIMRPAPLLAPQFPEHRPGDHADFAFPNGSLSAARAGPGMPGVYESQPHGSGFQLSADQAIFDRAVPQPSPPRWPTPPIDSVYLNVGEHDDSAPGDIARATVLFGTAHGQRHMPATVENVLDRYAMSGQPLLMSRCANLPVQPDARDGYSSHIEQFGAGQSTANKLHPDTGACVGYSSHIQQVGAGQPTANKSQKGRKRSAPPSSSVDPTKPTQTRKPRTTKRKTDATQHQLPGLPEYPPYAGGYVPATGSEGPRIETAADHVKRKSLDDFLYEGMDPFTRQLLQQMDQDAVPTQQQQYQYQYQQQQQQQQQQQRHNPPDPKKVVPLFGPKPQKPGMALPYASALATSAPTVPPPHVQPSAWVESPMAVSEFLGTAPAAVPAPPSRAHPTASGEGATGVSTSFALLPADRPLSQVSPSHDQWAQFYAHEEQLQVDALRRLKQEVVAGREKHLRGSHGVTAVSTVFGSMLQIPYPHAVSPEALWNEYRLLLAQIDFIPTHERAIIAATASSIVSCSELRLQHIRRLEAVIHAAKSGQALPELQPYVDDQSRAPMAAAATVSEQASINADLLFQRLSRS